MIEKVEQDLQRLALKARAGLSILAQLSRAGIELIRSEAEETILVRTFWHSLRLPRSELPARRGDDPFPGPRPRLVLCFHSVKRTRAAATTSMPSNRRAEPTPF